MPATINAPQQNFPSPVIRIFETSTALGNAAAQDIAACAAEAIAARGRFTVAISGGSLPKLVFPALIAAVPRHQWAGWHIFWADERMVPPTHTSSNFRLAWEMLLAHVSIPPKQIFPLDTTLPAAEAARKYQKIIETTVGNPPKFDVILLGMGPDGHTASLFPGHPLLSETARRVAPIVDSPKPPPKRVTLTLPELNRARCVFFIVTGGGKADILPRVLSPRPNDAPLPATMVHPPENAVRWYLDTAAAGKL